MPSSQSSQISTIVHQIRKVNPKSLLDVGIGFGKYGFLAREYLEFWDGRQRYSDWKRRIDGIEVFEDYITPAHRFIYNNLYIGNALTLIPRLRHRYDLVLLIDFIEHLEKPEGWKLLKACEERSRRLLISTPKKVRFCKGSFGNPHEAHVSQWNLDDFHRLRNPQVIGNKKSWIILTGSSG